MINIFKKWWFWLIVFFGILTIYGAVVGINQAQEEMESETVATEADPEEEVEDVGDWDEFKNFDNVVGKSDKDYSEISKGRPMDVSNDVTGNWRVTLLSENVDILEYAMSYYDTHMSDNEVHHIVNHTLDTTTMIISHNGLLTVEIKERVDREERDAKKLGSGELLLDYRIYPDGDIEKMEYVKD